MQITMCTMHITTIHDMLNYESYYIKWQLYYITLHYAMFPFLTSTVISIVPKLATSYLMFKQSMYTA